MQYILTEDEYRDLMQKASLKNNMPSPEKLRAACTRIADTMVLRDGWKKGEVWGCILSSRREWYCDDCPVKDICPYECKKWSK